MKNTIHVIAALTLSCLIAGNLAAQAGNPVQAGAKPAADAPVALSSTWMETRPGDFGAKSLGVERAAVPDSRHVEAAPVRFAWALKDISTTVPEQVPARVESRQYWADATGSELAGGISLPLTSRGAIVRVSPLEAGGGRGIDPASVRLAINGERVDSARSMLLVTDGVALKRLGMPVPQRTIAFKLDRSIPLGELELSVARLPADQNLVVHVFEPDSDWVAVLELPRDTYLAGEPMAFDFALDNGKNKVGVDSVQAFLADPFADKTWALAIDKTRGTLSRRAPSDRFVSGREGLFEAYLYLETMEDGLIIRRDLKLPVSIVPPLARFTGTTKATLDGGLKLELEVRSAVPARFQVNGQIFGTASDGTLKPLAMAQSAAVIDGRVGSIELHVAADQLKASGLNAPFEVRNLELLDQGRMFVLQRRQRGLLLED